MEGGSVGRPRNPALDDLILEAVRELLVEVGYHGFSVQEVTRRCNVHVRTITRRWPTKAELVTAAIAGGDEPGRPWQLSLEDCASICVPLSRRVCAT